MFFYIKFIGYVYDNETGLYYLKSRYYDPVTGRFLNADMYCDTQSNILGTNMFAYCNNNPVNQIDPEGTDACWVQFGNAVFGMGHTSLLLQDSASNWWYFYWGPKHVFLRPCGKDNFTVAELNSYLSGFDPRNKHNYYVFATNVIEDKEDKNYSAGENYYLKCHDLNVTNLIKLRGDFSNSFNYVKDKIEWLKIYSNATQLCETIYEGNKKYTMLHVCSKVYLDYYYNFFWKVGIPAGYYYQNIESENQTIAPDYNTANNNCVQVSMEVLLQGRFSDGDLKYENRIKGMKNKVAGAWPNNVMCEIFSLDIYTLQPLKK